MKRAGHLIERIAEMSNLELAYYKAQKGKSGKANVLAFNKDLRGNLHLLQAQLLSGDVTVGGYHFFTIFDPKKRQICAAPFSQRVMHHALMNLCHVQFEGCQTVDSFASRIGKGTYAALEQAHKNQKCHSWFLKLDVGKYFDSIQHDVLKLQLARLFKDPKLLDIFDAILDSYSVKPFKGVPIGNLTSQYFANHYLSPADHFVKTKLRIPAYIRYMDDMVLWHHDRASLLDTGKEFKLFIEEHLKMELKPFCLNHCSKGLPFLGYLVYPSSIRLAQRSRKRYCEKTREYALHLQNGSWSQKVFHQHMAPLIAFTQYADAKAFRQKAKEYLAQQTGYNIDSD